MDEVLLISYYNQNEKSGNIDGIVRHLNSSNYLHILYVLIKTIIDRVIKSF